MSSPSRQRVRRRGFPPSRSVIHVVVPLKSLRVRQRAKASVCPSGESTGSTPFPVPGTARTPEPSGATTKITRFCPCTPTKAIRLPSPDQLGAKNGNGRP